LDDFEVEQRLPTRSRKKGERDEFTVELRWGREDVSGGLSDGERCKGFEGCEEKSESDEKILSQAVSHLHPQPFPARTAMTLLQFHPPEFL